MQLSEEKYPIQGVVVNEPILHNVLEADVFRQRAAAVFEFLGKILGKSFGPFGAATLISDFPYTHATKDGYRIACNIALDHIQGSSIDRVIYRMALDICGRMNYLVGDGTTTAIIATNCMFQAAVKLIEHYTSIKKTPKDFIADLEKAKDMIIECLEKETVMPSDDTLEEIIKNVTYVSSNGDEKISNMIAEVYGEFKYPVIKAVADDSPAIYLTKDRGFPCGVRLADRLYVNSEGGIGEFSKVDVLVFDHQIKEATYMRIIRPLYMMARQIGRKLAVIAPSYDEVTLYNKMRRDVLEEFNTAETITLLIMSYTTNTDVKREAIYDLAMLLNTTVIDKTTEIDIIDKYEDEESGQMSPQKLLRIINVSDRDTILNAGWAAITEYPYDDYGAVNKRKENYVIRLGYADKISATMKNSIFVMSHYEQGIYDKTLLTAKEHLDSVIKEYAALGTYTVEVHEAQGRYVSLLMTVATIHVGGDSTLSRDMSLDQVEDAVRAAESAYTNGVVHGSNMGMISAINAAINKCNGRTDLDDIQKILKEFKKAFIAVCKRIFDNSDKFDEAHVDKLLQDAIKAGKVYDIANDSLSDKIINSAKTDIEVITSTVDLLKILLTGNQVLMARYEHRKIDPVNGQI